MADNADNRLIGKNYTPPDHMAKVTGKAKYAEDFRADGMLFCKLLLSPMPHARVRRIDLRAALAMPGVIAGTILSFILAMNAYATPVLLGGPTFQMMGPTVYNQFAGLSNWPFGAALSFVLMTATLLLTVTSNRAAHRRYRR